MCFIDGLLGGKKTSNAVNIRNLIIVMEQAGMVD